MIQSLKVAYSCKHCSIAIVCESTRNINYSCLNIFIYFLIHPAIRNLNRVHQPATSLELEHFRQIANSYQLSKMENYKFILVRKNSFNTLEILKNAYNNENSFIHFSIDGNLLLMETSIQNNILSFLIHVYIHTSFLLPVIRSCI